MDSSSCSPRASRVPGLQELEGGEMDEMIVLDTADIWGRIILCCRGSPVHLGCSAPPLWPPRMGCQEHLHAQCDNQKWLQTLPNALWGADPQWGTSVLAVVSCSPDRHKLCVLD